MKIAYLVVRTDHASVYYRTVQNIPHLAEAGIESAIITIPNTLYKRIALFRTLQEFQVVVLQRKLFNWINFTCLRHFAKKLIFDLDDALFLKDSKSPKSDSFTRRVRFTRTVRSCDHVICGNQYVLDKTKEFTPHATLIPTLVNTDIYKNCKVNKPNQGFTLVWIGGRSTLFYLEQILPALESLVPQISGLKLRVISDKFPESRILPIEKIPWSRETEIKNVKEADVGLMPLMDDDWSRGKCGLKLLQYAAAGLPMVCSPVGVNTKIVIHGETGFHATNHQEWCDSLITLAQDSTLRNQMGANAQVLAKKDFSLNTYKDIYIHLLKYSSQSHLKP